MACRLLAIQVQNYQREFFKKFSEFQKNFIKREFLRFFANIKEKPLKILGFYVFF